MAILQPGVQAPEIDLESTDKQNFSLAQSKGRPVILVFYPADWSPVCTDQLSLYNEILSEFEKYRAQLLGISVDSRWSHLAFQKERNLQFPLLSDFEPKGKVAKSYGVYQDQKGCAERALFVIDPKGVIQWSYLSPFHINPGADGIITALERLK